MRARIAFFMASLASGCLLFPSLDDLTDGGVDAQPEGEPNVESGADVKASDAADAGDAADATDAIVDAASDASSYCAQHAAATFCADFDENVDPASGFTTTYVSEGGVVSRDTLAYASPPASLVTGDLVLDAASQAHGAEVRSTGVTPTNGITFDVDVRVDKLSSQGTYIEALALVINAPVRSSLQLNLKATSEVGEEVVGLDGGKTYVGHLFPTLTIGTWTHLTFALVFKPTRTLTLTVDGTVVIDHVTLDASFSPAGALDLYLGNAYSPGPSDGAAIHFDNALLVVN